MADTPIHRWAATKSMSDEAIVADAMLVLDPAPSVILTMTETGDIVVASNIPWPYLDQMQDALSEYVKDGLETN